MNKNFLLKDNFDMPKILAELEKVGAVSVRAISDEALATLKHEVHSYEYTRQPEYLPSGVREQLSSCQILRPNGPCKQFTKSAEQFLNELFQTHAPMTLSTPLQFNETVLQRYDKDSTGISPHRDFSRCLNLICVLVISGKGRFCLCKDRQATGHHPLDARPGQLILMRSTGYLGTDIRPFHFIDQITEERYSLGLRHMA